MTDEGGSSGYSAAKERRAPDGITQIELCSFISKMTLFFEVGLDCRSPRLLLIATTSFEFFQICLGRRAVEGTFFLKHLDESFSNSLGHLAG